MKKPLLDVIFASEKRKGILMLLKDGPKETEDILKSLDTTRQALLPQMKILEEHYLVEHYEDIYELTTIGNIIVDEMLPLLDIIEVFDSSIDYWGTHQLDFLPSYILKKVNKLKICNVINPPLDEAYELNKQVVEDCYKSKSVFIIATFFHPMYTTLFSKLIENNVNIYAIFSQDVLDLIRSNYYAEYEKLRTENLIHLFLYPKKMNFQAFVLTDFCILMRLLKNNGDADSKHVICSNQSALE